MAINTDLPKLAEARLNAPDLDDEGELDVETYPLPEYEGEDPYLAEVWEAAKELLASASLPAKPEAPQEIPEGDDGEEEGAGDEVDPAKKGLGNSLQEVGRWLAERWAALESRYGRKTALAMAVVMLGTLPLPGNIPAIIGIAEGIRGLQGYFQREYDGEVEKLSITKGETVMDLDPKLTLRFPVNRLQRREPHQEDQSLK